MDTNKLPFTDDKQTINAVASISIQSKSKWPEQYFCFFEEILHMFYKICSVFLILRQFYCEHVNWSRFRGALNYNNMQPI